MFSGAAGPPPPGQVWCQLQRPPVTTKAADCTVFLTPSPLVLLPFLLQGQRSKVMALHAVMEKKISRNPRDLLRGKLSF